MKFNASYTKRINELVPDKDRRLKKIEDNVCSKLQREHPFQEKDFITRLVKKLLDSKDTTEIFDLN